MTNKDTATKEWILIDATDMVVGRLATQIAFKLRGKHKVNFTPHVDCGDNIVIINAEKVRFTGNKMEDKVYVRYTGYPGGERFHTPKTLMSKFPERIIELAVRRMLPKGILGRELYRNLHVYAGTTHPHEAQKPTLIKL